MDWQAFVLTEPWLARFQRLAHRRFGDEELATEAVTAVIDALSRDNWAALAGYDGRASERTYLLTVFNSALEDFSRARFGRPRPPAWVERLGTVWRRIYVMLCLERQPSALIVDLICQPASASRPTPSAGSVSPQLVHEAIHQIRAKVPHCGEKVGEVATEPEAVQLTHYPATGPVSGGNPESLLAREELMALLKVLTGLLQESREVKDPPNAVVAVLGEQITRLRAALAGQLTDDERLILRLVFQDNKAVAQAARALREKDHTVRRRLTGAVAKIRRVMEAAGLSAETMRAMLDEHAG